MKNAHQLLGYMLKAQQNVNDLMAPKWRTDRYDYTLAAGFEATELIGHNGYKWWKAEKKDVPQMQLEVVDITHFLISEVARQINDANLELSHLLKLWDAEETSINFDNVEYVFSDMNDMQKMKLMVSMLMVGRYSFSLLRELITLTGMTLDSWYKIYMSKNLLNEFRQKHGDRQGTYPRMWSNREDNEYLHDLIATWDLENEGPEVLYMRLEDSYRAFGLNI